MKRTTRVTAAVLLLAAAFLFNAGPVPGQDDWKAEFDDICSRTVDAMALSPAEIKGLVDRCDRLRPRIEKLEETTAKVYLKRLQMCRDLFLFVLENPAGRQDRSGGNTYREVFCERDPEQRASAVSEWAREATRSRSFVLSFREEGARRRIRKPGSSRYSLCSSASGPGSVGTIVTP